MFDNRGSDIIHCTHLYFILLSIIVTIVVKNKIIMPLVVLTTMFDNV